MVFFACFCEEKKPITFCGAFVHFLRTYEVTKFWKIKLNLDVSDSYTRANIQNMLIVAYLKFFGFFLLMLFYFMLEKDHFKQKLLLWPQVSVMITLIIIIVVCYNCYNNCYFAIAIGTKCKLEVNQWTQTLCSTFVL